MKPKLKKALKRAAIIGTGVLAFAGTVVGGYIVTPNRTKYIDVSVDTPEPTAFGQFVDRLTKDIGLEEDNTAAKYLRANFDHVVVEYKQSKDSVTTNTVKLDGNVDFRMSALSVSGVEFSVNAVADYNNRELPLTLGRFRKDVYFGLKDLKMKFTDFSVENLIQQYWYSFARYANFDFPQMLEGLGEIISEKFGVLIDTLMNGTEENVAQSAEVEEEESSSFDIASLILNPKEELIDGKWHIWLGEEGDDIRLEIITDEQFKLERVDFGTISVGNTTLSGAFDIELNNYSDFTSPASGNDYIEVFNYAGLTNKLVKLFKEDSEHQKAGFEFSLDLDDVADVTKVDIAKINGSMNIDFNELLDLTQYTLDENGDSRPRTSSSEDPKQELTVDEIIDKVGFNFQLDLLGQGDTEYANLDLSFAEGEGYVRFNEQEDINGNKKSVMKLNVDTETMNYIVDKIPDMIDSTSNVKSADSVSTLADFLTDDLVECIDEGDYSFILDMLETLENDENGIRVGLNLSRLGIGENARVNINVKNDARYPNLVLDPNQTAEERDAAFESLNSLDNASGFEIEANNIAFGDYIASVSAKTAEFSEVDLGHTSDYQSVKFIPDIIDQVSEFTQSKKTGFSLTGSMKDLSGLGLSFSGEGQLDNNDLVKEGYGNLEIKQYKYHADEVWATHKLALNVTNLDSNIEKGYDKDGNLVSSVNNNKALFIYGDPTGNKNIKGKFELQTFADILEIVKTFANDFGNEPKFTKFLTPIMNMLGFGVLGDIINEKDYVRLASNDLLKEVSVIDNGKTIRIVISQALLDLPSDITMEIGLKGGYNSEDQGLESLKIVNFALGSGDDAKFLNLDFKLEDFDENFNDPINKNATYMDLNGVKFLVDMGINTSKPNYWHLKANANISALFGAFNIDLDKIDFYIFVDGEKAKVYGKFDDIPNDLLYTQDFNILRSGHKLSSEMTFESFNDEEHDGVDGEFNIHRVLDEKAASIGGWLTGKEKHVYTEYHYRCDGPYFLDNVAKYLLAGLLGINNSYLSKLGADSTSSSSGSERAAGDFTNTFTDTGFSYDHDGQGLSFQHIIKVGINLDELTGISVLHELEATIKSKRYTYLDGVTKIDVLNSLNATLRVLLDVNVTFNASVENVEFGDTAASNAWNTNGEPNLQRLANKKINNVTIGKTSQYYNSVDNPYKYSYEKTITK